MPVEKVRTEYVSKTDSFIQKDSVLLHDSIYVERRGDTITTYKTTMLYKIQYRESNKTDTILKVDSIQVPYPVEKQLTKWQQMKMDIGGVAMLGFAVVIMIIVICFVLKWKKKE